MGSRLLSTIFIIMVPLCVILPQADTVQSQEDEIIRSLLEESGDETDRSGLIDKIEGLTSNPIDLNKASITDLMEIPGINLLTANKIIEYRNKYGKFFSTAELYSVEGLDDKTIKRIILFTTINDEKDVPNNYPEKYSLQFRNRVASDLQERDGFIRNKFYGNRLKTYSRLKASYGSRYEAGFTVDKDPGERIYSDMGSAYFSINNFGLIEKVIAGDFLTEFGQGLALWSPYSFSKGVDAVYPVKKRAHSISEYRSTDENKFFRGIASQINLKGQSISLFFSRNRIDARIDTLTLDILSTPIDGYHRTEEELQNKNTVSEEMIGGMLNLSISQDVKVGMLYYHSEFSNNFFSKNVYDLTGKKFNFYSFTFDVYHKNINIFGESAFNGKSLASILNLEIDLTDDFSFVSSVRNYPRNYFNIHSYGFGEKNITQNEFGIYNGIKWRTPIGLLNFYYDQYKFPFVSYSSPLPLSGDELLLYYETAPFRNLKSTLKIKSGTRETGINTAKSVEIYQEAKTSVRLELNYSASKIIELKNRVELSFYKISALSKKENGFLIFQDVKFMPAEKLYLNGRIIFFRTDSYNSAIFEYENDLDGYFSLYGLSGEGIRWYALLKFKLTEILKISLKYAETYKPGEKFIGSGYSKINGSLDNKISVQLDLNL